MQEGGELDAIDAVLAVVVVGTAAGPAYAAVSGARLSDPALLRRIARMAGQGRADEAFESALGGVGGHGQFFPSPQILTSLSSPGRISSTTFRIASILRRIRGHRFEHKTTIASRLAATFCWYYMFWSVVISRSYSSDSA